MDKELLDRPQIMNGKKMENAMLILKLIYYAVSLACMAIIYRIVMVIVEIEKISDSRYFAEYMTDQLELEAIMWICIGIGAVLITVLSGCAAKQIDMYCGFYRCKHCGHLHAPAGTEYEKGNGFLSKRYMRCPQCEKRSWHQKLFE